MATFFPLPCFFALFIPPLPRDGVISGTASSNTLCLGTGYRACLDASPMAAAFWVSFFVVVTLFTATLMAWNTARARERRRAQRTLDGLTSAGIRELAELRGPGSAVSPVYFASEECLWRARLGVQMVVQGAPLQPDDPRLDVLSSYRDQDPRLWWSLALTGHIVSFVELPPALDEALCSKVPVRGGRTVHLGAVRPDERVAGDTWPPECGKRVPGLWVVVQWDYAHASTERTLRLWSSRLGVEGEVFERHGTDGMPAGRRSRSRRPAARTAQGGAPVDRPAWEPFNEWRHDRAWVTGTGRDGGLPLRRGSSPTLSINSHRSASDAGEPDTNNDEASAHQPDTGDQRPRRRLAGVPTLSLLPVYDMLHGACTMHAWRLEHSDARDGTPGTTVRDRIPGASGVYAGVYGLDTATGALHTVPCVHPLDEPAARNTGATAPSMPEPQPR